MAIDYLSCFERAEELCDDFEKQVVAIFFEQGRKKESLVVNFCWTEIYRRHFKPIKACVHLCEIAKVQSIKKHHYDIVLTRSMSSLETPKDLENLEDFKKHVSYVKLGFEIVKGERLAFCLAFNEEEKERMNEAIHAHLEDCNYSCVAMSVSAVESRLLKLMCLASPKSEKELEEKTLGQLIFEYINNKDQYKNVVPKRHEHLLQLCNTYRTFSVHPKKQKVDGMVTHSILNLTIAFLTDQNTKPEVVKAQLRKSRRKAGPRVLPKM
jgi:hypothetical protein